MPKANSSGKALVFIRRGEAVFSRYQCRRAGGGSGEQRLLGTDWPSMMAAA